MTLAVCFLVTRAPSVLSNMISVLDSHLVSFAALPLLTLAFGFPGSCLISVDVSVRERHQLR